MRKVKFADLPALHQELVANARNARENAYAPYSHYRVGAAVLTENRHIYRGCNVETATYSQTTHAERAAITNMVAHGEKVLVALCCIAQADGIPCAECRQVIWEFCHNDQSVEIISVSAETLAIEIYTIGELYPYPFGPSDLGITI